MNIPVTTEEFCAICLEPYTESNLDDAVRLGCQHAFGRRCSQAWASQCTICPTCRSDFSPESLRADENTPLRIAGRPVVTLHEKKFAAYTGLIVSLFACSCITIPIVTVGAGAVSGLIILFLIGLLAGIYSICKDHDPLERYFYATTAICFLMSGLALLITKILTDIN